MSSVAAVKPPGPVHPKVNGATPFTTVASIEPSAAFPLSSLHVTSVNVDVALNKAGTAISSVVDVEQELNLV